MTALIQQFGDANVLYVIFGIIVLVFLGLDLGILQRVPRAITLRSALLQTAGWVSVALAYGYLVFHYHGTEKGLQYYSAYVMEYSLSADNIFVFILILTYFNVSEEHYQRVLFYGIIGAVIFRLIFILIGIVAINQFHWILYVLGAVLIYSGVRILIAGDENHFEPQKNFMYRMLKRRLPIVDDEGDGGFTIIRDGKKYFTILFLVIMIIAFTDLLFAIDSIPAVFAISQDKLVIITSNVFAVMGLRAMFFLLKGIADKFDYLQEGISCVLIFIGVKMLLEIFDIHVATEWSLAVIISILFISVMVSLFKKKPSKNIPEGASSGKAKQGAGMS